MKHGAIVLSSVCSFTVGCTSEIEPVRWTALDRATVVELVEEPQATLSEDGINELLAEMVDDQDVVRAIEATLSLGLETIETSPAPDDVPTTPDIPPPPDTEDDTSETGPLNLSGTSVFVRIACTGVDSDEPDPDFSFGFLRLDSENFSRDNLETIESEGNFLGTFEDCVTPEGTFNGTVRIRYEAEPDALFLDPELEITEIPDGSEDDVLDTPAVATEAWVYSVFPLESSTDSLTVGIPAEVENESVVAVYGSDGLFVCELPPADPDCQLSL